MISPNVYTNNVIPDDISTRLEQYYIHNNDKNIFIQKLKNLLYENYEFSSRDEKAKNILNIIDVLNEYSHVWKNSNNTSLIRLSNTIKDKFTEFSKEKEVQNECASFLLEHFDDKCKAYTRWGIRCKNNVHPDVKGNFCKVHVNFYPKIISILGRVIPTEISHKCAKLVYEYD